MSSKGSRSWIVRRAMVAALSRISGGRCRRCARSRPCAAAAPAWGAAGRSCAPCRAAAPSRAGAPSRMRRARTTPTPLRSRAGRPCRRPVDAAARRGRAAGRPRPRAGPPADPGAKRPAIATPTPSTSAADDVAAASAWAADSPSLTKPRDLLDDGVVRQVGHAAVAAGDDLARQRRAADPRPRADVPRSRRRSARAQARRRRAGYPPGRDGGKASPPAPSRSRGTTPGRRRGRDAPSAPTNVPCSIVSTPAAIASLHALAAVRVRGDRPSQRVGQLDRARQRVGRELRTRRVARRGHRAARGHDLDDVGAAFDFGSHQVQQLGLVLATPPRK